mgnify:CR=1 FL=1
MTDCVGHICDGIGCRIEGPDNTEWPLENKQTRPSEGRERMPMKSAENGLFEGSLLDKRSEGMY